MIIVILLVGWISSVAGLFLEVEINGDVNVLGILITRGGVKPIETMIVPIGYMNINVTIIMNGYASKKINQKTSHVLFIMRFAKIFLIEKVFYKRSKI